MDDVHCYSWEATLSKSWAMVHGKIVSANRLLMYRQGEKFIKGQWSLPENRWTLSKCPRDDWCSKFKISKTQKLHFASISLTVASPPIRGEMNGTGASDANCLHIALGETFARQTLWGRLYGRSSMTSQTVRSTFCESHIILIRKIWYKRCLLFWFWLHVWATEFWFTKSG